MAKKSGFFEYVKKAFLNHWNLLAVGAAGLASPAELSPRLVQRRTSQTEVKSYEEIYAYLRPGALLGANPPQPWGSWLAAARSADADWSEAA